MDRIFDGLTVCYYWSLRGVFNHRYVMVAVFFTVVGGTLYLFQAVPKGFIPDTDNDSLNVTVEAAQGTSYYKMVDYVKRVSEVLRRDPNVDSFMSRAGGNYCSTNRSNMNVLLKPRKERPLAVWDVINELRPKVSGFPGFRVFMTRPAPIRIGG